MPWHVKVFAVLFLLAPLVLSILYGVGWNPCRTTNQGVTECDSD